MINLKGGIDNLDNKLKRLKLNIEESEDDLVLSYILCKINEYF